MNRRKMLSTIGISTIGGALLTSALARRVEASDAVEAGSEAPVDDGRVDLLFVQNSKGMRFDNGQLTLVDVDPNTLFFSDRPEDIAGFLSFEELVDLVGEGPENFNEEPPNATLMVFDESGLSQSVMVLSGKPRLEGKDMIFPKVQLTEGTPPASGGATALFIDSIGRPLTPNSIAGVHRRHRRRRRRHAVRTPGPI